MELPKIPENKIPETDNEHLRPESATAAGEVLQILHRMNSQANFALASSDGSDSEVHNALEVLLPSRSLRLILD